MNLGDYLTAVIGSGIGYGLAAVFMRSVGGAWTRKAHKLAAQSDIALPGPLEGKVARFLRSQFLFGLLAQWIVMPLLMELAFPIGGRHDWARWLPWLMVGLPLALALCSYTLIAWPRWTTSSEGLVTCLRQLPVRQAFTAAEVTVSLFGAGLAAAAGAWGLRLASARPWWWAAFAAAFAMAVLAWWIAARSVMRRPSGGSDTIERGWDDVIRFRRVRDLTMGAAVLPAFFMLLIDSAAPRFGVMTGNGADGAALGLWPPLLLGIGAFVVVLPVFRQGRQLWRRAWAMDGTP